MDRAGFAQEVIAIREGRFTTVYHDFSREEMDEIIAYLVTLGDSCPRYSLWRG